MKNTIALIAFLSCQAFADATITISGLPGSETEDNPVCYDSNTGKLGNCPTTSTSQKYWSSIAIDAAGNELGIKTGDNSFMSLNGYTFEINRDGELLAVEGDTLVFDNSSCSGDPSYLNPYRFSEDYWDPTYPGMVITEGYSSDYNTRAMYYIPRNPRRVLYPYPSYFTLDNNGGFCSEILLSEGPHYYYELRSDSDLQGTTVSEITGVLVTYALPIQIVLTNYRPLPPIP